MNKREIISKVRELNLPQDSFVVFGSCPLAAVGIREANDIDFLVSSEVAKNLKSKGWKQITKSKDDKPYVSGVYEAHTNWAFTSYKPTLKQLLATAHYIDGIPFASLYEVKKWKEASARPKDLKDLELLDAYLTKRKGKQATITICSSASFYKQAIDVQQKLRSSGYKAIIPSNAEVMKRTGDFEPNNYKTWLDNADDYHKKTTLVRQHFSEVERGDAVLVLNYEKHGLSNYIGGNVLMEMAIAFFLNKPIFILNEAPSESAYLEEIFALNPVILHGKLEDLLISV